MFFSLFFALPLFAQTDTAWVRTYWGGPYTDSRSICLDSFGNVYVAGICGGDYITIKYYPNGDTSWVRRYNGPASGLDYARAIGVDYAGNVYVTGVTGYGSNRDSFDDYATLKYDSCGNEIWVKIYNGPGNYIDEAWGLTIDKSGNVYVTGCSVGNGTGYDYATIKYDPDGNELWVKRYNKKYGDMARAITIDDSNNIYVTGQSQDSVSSSDYATIKYDRNGYELWISKYNGPANSFDEGFAISVDDYSNVYVTGRSYGDGTDWDYVTIKYDPNGNELWARRYNRSESYSEEIATDIVVDGSGNVYVTGFSGYYPDYDYLTIKYDFTGNQLWLRTYDGIGNSYDNATAIALDDSDNVYVTGFSALFKSDPFSFDYATIKYAPDGNEVCVKRYNGPGNSVDMPLAIAVDDSFNIYLTGSTNGVSLLIIKYFPIILVGDANSDGSLNVSDLVYLINYLFKGGSAPNPLLLADLNNDEYLTVSDVIYLINYLFKGGPSPIC